jgi:hypothetical protein
MQFRAELQGREGRWTVRLAGRLEGEQSAELVRLCDEARTPERLDLTDLLSVDAVGLDTLRALQSRGAELVGASPYLALQLEAGQTRRAQEQKGSVVLAPGARARRINDARSPEDK